VWTEPGKNFTHKASVSVQRISHTNREDVDSEGSACFHQLRSFHRAISSGFLSQKEKQKRVRPSHTFRRFDRKYDFDAQVRRWAREGIAQSYHVPRETLNDIAYDLEFGPGLRRFAKDAPETKTWFCGR